MLVTIHQPDFAPWVGFFQRWNLADVYIVLDDVQFLRRGWHHRDKIKTKQGAKWLTLPTCKSGKRHQLINEVVLDGTDNWRRSLPETIRHAYHKSPFFDEHFDALKSLFLQAPESLFEFNMSLLNLGAEYLGVSSEVVCSSSLRVDSKSSQRLVELVHHVGGTRYLVGSGSRAYLDVALFEKAGIEVVWYEPVVKAYEQLHGQFIPGLSMIDFMLMGVGREEVLGNC